LTQPLTLPFFVELLIMWLLPNILFGWKVGGGGKLQTFCKLNGKYVDPVIAYGGSILWILLVNYGIYPVISATVESFFTSIDPKNYAILFIIILAIGYGVFKKQRWS